MSNEYAGWEGQITWPIGRSEKCPGYDECGILILDVDTWRSHAFYYRHKQPLTDPAKYGWVAQFSAAPQTKQQ